MVITARQNILFKAKLTELFENNSCRYLLFCENSNKLGTVIKMYPMLIGELKTAMTHGQILPKNMVGHCFDKLLISYWQKKGETQILFIIDLVKVNTQVKRPPAFWKEYRPT